MSKIMELAEYYATLREDGVRRELEDEARSALAAEVEKLEAEVFDVTSMYNRCVEDVHALREKLAAVEKDAERYRWLREQNADLDAGFYVGDETDALPEDITWVGSDLDAAIDAAMEPTK